MYSFLGGLVLLLVGYMIYGSIINKIFGADDRETPCVKHPDGVDYVPISKGRAFLIQLLNIAGPGPIFGALTGAIWGPQVYLWIVFGAIFAGAVHDYLVGMISMRNNGASISELTGKYLGVVMLQVMRVFSVVLLVMAGVVSMVGPAQLLAVICVQGPAAATSIESAKTMTLMGYNTIEWTEIFTVIILVYYFLATLLPIDKLIGKLYPIFGICLIFMALGIGSMTVYNHINGTRPMIEIWEGFYNMHPNSANMPVWPLMFITVACGAISGFHATQSPMMARCLTSEREGRFVFYGAMIAEGVIALIWASAGIAFYNKTGGGFSTEGLLAIGGGNSTSVYQISLGLLGSTGSILAVLGVVACPITSGDTAFRSVRLTLADWFKIDQKNFAPRFAVAFPLLALGYAISFINYNVIWRYFSWANQTLAMIALWAGAVYLCRNSGFRKSLAAAIPAAFMSAVTVTYFCIAPECYLMLERNLAYGIGIGAAILFFAVYYFRVCLNFNELQK